MASTTIQQALESFSLQRESHIRQQALIREKQRCHMWAEQQKQHTGVTGSIAHPAKASSNQEQLHSPSSDVDMTTSDKSSYARSLRESDSLLRFLNNRAAMCKEFNVQWQEFAYQSDAKDGEREEKDDKVIMSRLLCQNDALRNHILEFLKEAEENHKQIAYLQRELDFCRKENRDLKDRLSKTEPSARNTSMPDSVRSDTFYSMPIGLNLENLPELELPPLEMPKFDFDLLKTCSDDEIASQ